MTEMFTLDSLTGLGGDELRKPSTGIDAVRSSSGALAHDFQSSGVKMCDEPQRSKDVYQI